MDKHHNVGTARRTITYHLSEDGDEALTEQTEEAEGEEEEAAGQEQAVQTEPKEEETLQPDGARPALALTSTETTIAVGTAFDPMSVVKDAVDDVDTKTLCISGSAPTEPMIPACQEPIRSSIS